MANLESQHTSDRVFLVQLLKEHRILLNKSMQPKIIAEKEMAMKKVQEDYCKNVDKPLTINQLKKCINNMKANVKKKIDAINMSNKPLKLSAWEKEMQELLSEENPIYLKVADALKIEIHEDMSSDENLPDYQDIENDTSNPSEASVVTHCHTNIQCGSLKRKSESEETSALSNEELQRLLLVEQLKLTRMQMEREQLLIKVLRKRVSNENPDTDEDFVTDLHNGFYK